MVVNANYQHVTMALQSWTVSWFTMLSDLCDHGFIDDMSGKHHVRGLDAIPAGRHPVLHVGHPVRGEGQVLEGHRGGSCFVAVVGELVFVELAGGRLLEFLFATKFVSDVTK